jgi:hypothetical protein
MMTVAAQLTIWIAHFMPPVHAMPIRNDRSSACAAGWLSVPAGVGDGWTTMVLIGGLPVLGTAATRILMARSVVCPFRETNGSGAAARADQWRPAMVVDDGAEA